MMARRSLLAFSTFLLLASIAHAVITAPVQLGDFLKDSDNVFVAKVASIAGDKLVFTPTEDLKGKFEFKTMPVLVKPDEDGVKLNHVPQLMKRLAVGLPLVVFASGETEYKAYAYTNGTWIQLLGKETEKGKAVWTLTHGEPYLRKMYAGTTDELAKVLKGVIAKKAKAPELDKDAEPGFGPEVKTSFLQRRGAVPFAVIPTVGLLGPIAILAILFPTVFGGVLILFRQWTAFITMFSINSMLLLYFWLHGYAYFVESWWGTDLGVWSIVAAVTIACTLWAWSRQLTNLEQGADCLETPVRTELLVLSVLSATCVAFMVASPMVAPMDAKDPFWNLTLVLAAGIVVGLAFRLYHSRSAVMLPMATEGVMLGVASLACIGVFVFLAQAHARPSSPGLTMVNNEGNTSPIQLKGEKWKFESKRFGIFASSPAIANGHVYAASSHPAPNCFGFLSKIDLDKGEEVWKFGGGRYRRPISMPVVAGDRVYIGEGWHGDPACKVYCIGDADGKLVWDFPTQNQTESTPTITDGKLYTGCGNDGFRCLNAADGKELWRFPAPDAKGRLLRFASGNSVAGGRVFVGTGVDRDVEQGGDKGETAVLCLDAATGKQLWKVEMPQPVWAKPVVHRGELFVAVGNGDVFNDVEEGEPAGAVYCMNTGTGDIIWKRDLPNGVLQEPAVDKHRLYVGCRDGRVYALDRKDGAIVWDANLGDPIIGTPALVGFGPRETPVALYAVSNMGRVACLAPENGLRYWTHDVNIENLRFIAAPAVAVRPTDAGEQHLIVLAGGDPFNELKATLICLEGSVSAK